MGPHRRAALSGMEEEWQALGLDLQKVSRQDLSRNTARAGTCFSPETNRLPLTGGHASSSSSVCVLVPWYLPGQISERDLIALSASRIAGAGTVEGSGVQGKEDGGYQMHRWNITKENGEVVIESRHKAHRIMGNNSWVIQ